VKASSALVHSDMNSNDGVSFIGSILSFGSAYTWIFKCRKQHSWDVDNANQTLSGLSYSVWERVKVDTVHCQRHYAN